MVTISQHNGHLPYSLTTIPPECHHFIQLNWNFSVEITTRRKSTIINFRKKIFCQWITYVKIFAVLKGKTTIGTSQSALNNRYFRVIEKKLRTIDSKLIRKNCYKEVNLAQLAELP